ncbi:SEC-C domain-containing protein [Virgibacillus sp. NKC19-16]|uniref:SEC-C metal-binding domain-containing protein n=1 Tax=Virgibacillus salidurans TaxID=2831673 RepID=UPI001F186469|nr:SEC-C metal-binding domain-containing protein [Virgibacillus sp. NKC19-16]UJL45851.1 SEC-C domain-containing protein [Virgibacillus sp. NKC19-16]
MSKLGRNDPCSCGSGKKYKKCCGASNVVEIGMGRYNVELDTLHNNLIAFAIDEHESKMKNLIIKYPQPSLQDDGEAMDTYMTGITPWIIMNVPLLAGGRTIYEAFYHKEKAKIKHTRIKNTFEEWGNCKPSVYEILTVDNQTKKIATLKDVFTHETYDVPQDEGNDFEEGNVAIGILLPYVDHHQFLFTTMELPGQMKEDIIHLGKRYIDEAGETGLANDFPNFIGEALSTETTKELEWENPLYEMVADLFTSHMRLKTDDEDVIATGVLIWNAHCHMHHPSFKKPGAYAAALEHLIYNQLIGHISQSELAKEYRTNASSISKKSRYIRRTMSLMEETLQDMVEEGDLYESFIDERIDIEKMMRDMQKALEEQNIESEAELDAFMDEFMKSQDIPYPVPSSPRDQAQDKLYEAQAEKGEKRRKLIQEALDIYPNSPDAYLLMAQNAKSINEQHHLFHQAVIAGEKDLGKDFFNENKGHFWMMTETKAYMQAKESYATIRYKLGDKESAMEQYEELLELNPNDNQGIRYELLPLYIEEEKYIPAKNLIKQYEDETSANFLFNKALLNYLISGITHETKAFLKKATKENPYVKDYLLGNKPIPKTSYAYIGIGDESEAIEYTQGCAHLWEGAQGLLEEL